MATTTITRIPAMIQCFRYGWTTSFSFPTFAGQQGIVLSNNDVVFIFWSSGDGQIHTATIYGNMSGLISVSRSGNTVTVTSTANRAYTVFTLI